jgi:hypothetical protein
VEENKHHLQEPLIVKSNNWTYFAGVIERSEVYRFKTMLFRKSKGNALMYYKDFNNPDVKSKELLSLFVIMIQSGDTLTEKV